LHQFLLTVGERSMLVTGKQNFVMHTLQNLLSPEGLFLAQNAPKIVCRPASARTRWGSLQRSPDPLAEFKGPTSKEREGREGEGREGIRELQGRGAKALGPAPTHNFWLRHCKSRPFPLS